METRKYLMIDHGGVLDDFAENVGKNDIVLNHVVGGGYRVFKNGVVIIKLLNELVKHNGYQIVFHSANREEQQLNCLEELNAACAARGLKFPRVYAMAVFNKDKYGEVLPSSPDLGSIEYNDGKNQYKIKAACYGQIIAGIESNGKRDIRQALAVLLNINSEDRGNHIVFDDGQAVINKAEEDGYQVCHVVDGLEMAERLQKMRKEENRPFLQGFFGKKAKKQEIFCERKAVDDASQEYQEFINHRNQLVRELNVNKSMYKERKQFKIIFLDEVLNHYESNQEKEKSIKDSVQVISAGYAPEALKQINAGIKSTRTHKLLSKFNK